MKKIFFPVFILVCLSVNSQFKQIASGPIFEAPEKGFAKLILFKSDAVMYIKVAMRGGIDIRLYDPSHKETVAKSLDPSYGKLKSGKFEAAFEISGDAILIISEWDEGRPVLYRLIIDGTTGDLKKEEKICSMNKTDIGKAYAVVFGNTSLPQFLVANDPISNSYAVATFNTFTPDKNKLIETVWYGSDHFEIKRAFYTVPGDKYKLITPTKLFFAGPEKLVLLAEGLHKEDKENDIMLACFKKDASSFEFHEVSSPASGANREAVAIFHPGMKKIILSKRIYDKKIEKHTISTEIIDPVSLKVEKTDIYNYSEQIIQWLRDTYGKKYSFDGVVDDIYLNKDGGFSITLEDWKSVSYSSSGGNYSYSSSTLITMGIMVIMFDKDGDFKNSYVVPKNYRSNNDYGNPEIFAMLYKRYTYLSGPNKNYILLNDTPRNIERQEKKQEPIAISALSDCDAFCFALTGTEPAPVRKFFFGEPDSKKDRSMAPFPVSTYDTQKDLFIVLQSTMEGRSKGLNITWLKPQ